MNFSNHAKEKISKANNGITILRKLCNVLPKYSLIAIYKFFIRPHLDYGAIIFDQTENETFVKNSNHFTRNTRNITTYSCRSVLFNYLFSPWTINGYIEKVSIKSDAKVKYYQISKNYCELSANSLPMITQFL